MRTAISQLVTSFVFGSLAVNFQAIRNSLVNKMFSTSIEQELLLSQSNSNNNTAPHRGSGRRDFVEYFNHA